MDKEYIKKMYMETLTEEEQYIIKVLSVICSEGISIDIACKILMPKNPQHFNTLMDSLCSRSWLFYDHRTVLDEPEISQIILEVSPIDSDLSIRILSSLLKNIVMKPLNDMMAKREYFVATRLFLSYLMRRKEELLYKDNELKSLFSDVVIAFSTNSELSLYGNKRQPVWYLEDRIDFKLLNLLKELNGANTDSRAFILLGRLYTSIFRYNEAKTCFHEAEVAAGDNAELLLAQAIMYENLGIRWKNFHYAYRAYLTNSENRNVDACIGVCLYIAYLCALNMAPKDCKRWRNKARTLLGARTMPSHHIFNIMLKEIEALLHLHDMSLAFQILDAAELEVCQLYGGNAPELARIALIRGYVYGEAGQLRNGNEEYRRYVDINHYNYAYSKGDTAVLYSGIINDNIIRGNVVTANYFAVRMQRLYAEDPSIAPGVRFGEAVSNSLACMAGGEIQLCKAYLEIAQCIYEEELKPNEELLKEIAPVFHNKVIPKSVLMKDEQGIINLITLNIYLGNNQIDKAKRLIEKLIKEESEYTECTKWHIQMGRALIKEGSLYEGLKLWENIFNEAATAHKIEIAQDITEWTTDCDLSFETIKFFEGALQADTMVYARTCDIAKMLRKYADILELSGSYGNSEEPWEQAIMLMNSLDDKDGIAQVYMSWGISKEGKESEELLHKAIKFWKPEHFVFDETLSKMYYYLYHAQIAQNKLSQAESSARKSIRLCPSEYPPGTFSEVGL